MPFVTRASYSLFCPDAVMSEEYTFILEMDYQSLRRIVHFHLEHLKLPNGNDEQERFSLMQVNNKRRRIIV